MALPALLTLRLTSSFCVSTSRTPSQTQAQPISARPHAEKASSPYLSRGEAEAREGWAHASRRSADVARARPTTTTNTNRITTTTKNLINT